MFTGIVERTAAVVALDRSPGRIVISVEVRPVHGEPPWTPVRVGESVSVSGVCLTVVSEKHRGKATVLSFDAVPETLSRTTLGGLRAGDRVNIERSLRVGDSLGGHYVTGHVDGVATVLSRRQQGDQILFEIEAARDLLRHIIPKGSVAVDGISLTVVDVDASRGRFTFAAIPHTLRWTTLGQREPRSQVNIETDAFGKWVLHGLAVLGTVPSAGDGPVAGRVGATSRDERLRSLLEANGLDSGPAMAVAHNPES